MPIPRPFSLTKRFPLGHAQNGPSLLRQSRVRGEVTIPRPQGRLCERDR